MELVSHKKIIRPFIFRGKQCIVVPNSTHVIRIFYNEHVYDVLLSHEELMDWIRCGTEWQKEYVKRLLRETLLDSEYIERNSSIEDGYLA
jgi:hypothetical protein